MKNVKFMRWEFGCYHKKNLMKIEQKEKGFQKEKETSIPRVDH